MTRHKIAIVGCGTVAQRYYAPALKKYPDLKENLIFIDRIEENALAMQSLLGCGSVCTDHKGVAEEAAGAVILVPHHFHYSVSMDFLNAGAHVLCEKPLAVLPEQAREMIEAADRHNVKLCVNNTRRTFPSFRVIEDMIRIKKFGKVRSIEYYEGSLFGWPSSTGFYVNPALTSQGILLDLGSHAIDTICWWLGGKPDLAEYFDDSYGGPESVVKIIAEKDGCTVRVTLNRLCELSNSYRVSCESGTMEGRINDWTKVSLRNGQGQQHVLKLRSPSKNYPGFVVPVVENFLNVIRGIEQPLVSGLDVLPSLEFIQECYRNRKRLDLPWDRNITIHHPDVRASGSTHEQRILVTGATGFIGGRIMEMLHLAQEGGDNARAGVRSWASAARLGRLPVKTVGLNLLDRRLLDEALDGVTHVIHCAKGTPEDTVEGTRNLLDAALKANIRHVVHLSTADVYGNASGIIDERNPYQYTGNQYNRMKIDAEKVCWDYHAKGLPITIFRPSIVYGPFSSAWSLRFASMFLAGEWGIYERYGEGKCNLVYIDDLVRTILAALDDERAIGKAFNINGPDIVSWNDYFTALNKVMGLPPLKMIPVREMDASTYMMEPVRLLGGVVKKYFMKPVKKAAESFEVLDAAMRRLEHAAKVTPALDELKLFTKNVIYSDALARSALTYCPNTRLDAGLAQTCEWLTYIGILNSR